MLSSPKTNYNFSVVSLDRLVELMPAEPSDFRYLLKQVRAGDGDALNSLVRQYESELLKVVKARLGNALRPYFDSVDLVQSVHKSVLVGLRNDKFDLQSPEHLIRLASMIVRRKIARYWKRHRRQLRLDNANSVRECDSQGLANLILASAKVSESPTSEVELNDRLGLVLERLEPLDQRIIELRLEGFNTSEAARSLGQDPDVLRARLARLRRKLNAAGITSEAF